VIASRLLVRRYGQRLFRTTIWNETIPTRLRGRLSGVEMISYMSGPLSGICARLGGVGLVEHDLDRDGRHHLRGVRGRVRADAAGVLAVSEERGGAGDRGLGSERSMKRFLSPC